MHADDWDDMAKVDPLWAVLSSQDKRDGQWNLDEFFATGEREIAALLAGLEKSGRPRERKAALDFGCGPGRLTRPLAARFDVCQGVDISEVMILKARELNAAFPKCAFTTNLRDDLSIFPESSFDLIYSNIVLQHLPSGDLIARFIAEFVRTLKPGGVAVFQLPSHIPLRNRLQLRRRAYGLLRFLGFSEKFLYRTLRLVPIRMNGVSEDRVRGIVEAAGGSVVDIARATFGRLVSSTYQVAKGAAK